MATLGNQPPPKRDKWKKFQEQATKEIKKRSEQFKQTLGHQTEDKRHKELMTKLDEIIDLLNDIKAGE